MSKLPNGLPPAAVGEAWMAVDGDDHAHKFTRGNAACLCGKWNLLKVTGRVTSLPERAQFAAVKVPRLPYCERCKELNELRWLHAYERAG